MNYRELKEWIAISILILPCTDKELAKRDFLNDYSFHGVQGIIQSLEKDAIYYRGQTMHINKKYAQRKLSEYL